MTALAKVIVSPSDKRIYKAVKLDNEIDCLLIQDVDALKSSAALSVGVGSFRDPLTAQGIAHYLEHMLFMGTEKYPDENDYSSVHVFITLVHYQKRRKQQRLHRSVRNKLHARSLKHCVWTSSR